MNLELPSTKKICLCEHCKVSRKASNLKSRLPKKLQPEFDALCDYFWSRDEEQSTELAVLTSKIEGSWPKEEGEKYYTRIDSKLYEIHSKLVKQNYGKRKQNRG